MSGASPGLGRVMCPLVGGIHHPGSTGRHNPMDTPTREARWPDDHGTTRPRSWPAAGPSTRTRRGSATRPSPPRSSSTPATSSRSSTRWCGKVEADGATVSGAAGAFGMSRQSYYSAAAALAADGLAGLLPAKPGPRGAHKLTDEVLDHLEALRAEPTRAWARPHSPAPSRSASASRCTPARWSGPSPGGRWRGTPKVAEPDGPERRCDPAGLVAAYEAMRAAALSAGGRRDGATARACSPAGAWRPGRPRGPPW